jgi:hypothetical protein
MKGRKERNDKTEERNGMTKRKEGKGRKERK